MIKFANEKTATDGLMAAMKSGDEAKMKKAWNEFHDSIAQQVINDFREYQKTEDKQLLVQRGYRQLTSRETAWYQKLIGALQSPNPKEAFVTILGSGEEDALMPETIIEDVYRDLEETHPLLSRISFTYTAYATKWILNDHDREAATWGTITAAIAEEITSAFKVIDLTHNKLSCYAIIEKGMLDLGPTFLDGYIRRCLREAMACGLEKAIVSGDGSNCPVGLDRDVHEGVSVSAGKYPQKTTGQNKEVVKSFDPASYGALVAKIAQTEGGKARNVTGLTLVCNPTDYYTKVMPATTVLNANGAYVNNLFPVPTDVVTSVYVPTGSAILFDAPRYRLFAGGQRQNVIEYSDEYKFIEDQRVFKVKQYATGMAEDNNAALLLDISGLKPGYINVQIAGQPISTTVEGTVTTTPSA